MKARYRFFKRGSGIYFIQDNITGKQESLRTRDKEAARRIFHAQNEAHEQAAISRQIAKAYLAVSDPNAGKGGWTGV